MAMAATEIKVDFLTDLERELHDLCQPLTTLQCRLELAEMCGDDVSLMEGVKGGLVETTRLFAGIQTMRERLQRELGRKTNGDETVEE